MLSIDNEKFMIKSYDNSESIESGVVLTNVTLVPVESLSKIDSIVISKAIVKIQKQQS